MVREDKLYKSLIRSRTLGSFSYGRRGASPAEWPGGLGRAATCSALVTAASWITQSELSSGVVQMRKKKYFEVICG